MSSKKRRRRALTATKLMLTPVIDIFVLILIFLILNYAPEQSKIKKSEGIKIPLSESKLTKAPRYQIEVTETYVHINGVAVQGLTPADSTPATWKALLTTLQALKAQKTPGVLEDANEPVLIIADRSTSYQYIDKTVSYVAAAGFSEVYFLTEEGKIK